MKVLIMAGGYATRLWPITKGKPKPLLAVGDKYIIDYILEKVRELDLEVYVSTNKFFERHFKEWAERSGVELIVEETISEEEKLGTIGAIKYAVSKIGVDDYLIVAGDNLFSFSLKEFLRRYDGKPLICLLYTSPSPRDRQKSRMPSSA